MLAEEGFRLLLVAREEGRLQDRARALAQRGGEVHALAVDLAGDNASREVRARAEELLGPTDLLVNNAGVGWSDRLERKSPEEVDREMLVDLLAPVRLSREFLPGMLARGRGHLIAIGSGSADVGVPRLVTYSSAKAGLRAFATTLDLETRRRGVRSSIIEPIFVRTEFGRRPSDQEPPVEALARRHPRWVLEPAVVAEAVRRTLYHPRPLVRVPWAWAAAHPLVRGAARLARGRLELPPPRRSGGPSPSSAERPASR